jgi:hypothetical protein
MKTRKAAFFEQIGFTLAKKFGRIIVKLSFFLEAGATLKSSFL